MSLPKPNAWHVLAAMVLVYAILAFSAPRVFAESFGFFVQILVKIAPIFVLIFVLMVLLDRYVDNRFLIKQLRGNKFKAWVFILLGGVLSTGPMYVWYPLLRDLRDKGVRDGEIAAFLYARAIKPAYLPLMVLYFGLFYTGVLSVLVLAAAVLQGLLIGRLLGREAGATEPPA